MTQLTYNGILLELISTKLIGRTPIFSPDGTDYLYTHWIIDVSAIYNGGATSYTSNGSQDGTLPAVTDASVRHLLSLPRQALSLSVGADYLLNLTGVDANNGPIPKAVNIKRITGVQTFVVEFQVECWINECPGSQLPTLLTNRWQTHDHVDENFMTTKVTRGLAVFRTDLLIAAGNSPDHFRNQVLPPIPLGFKRTQIDVTMHPSLNSLSYEVVDQEQIAFIGNQHTTYGVTKFEAFYQQSTTSGTEGGAASGLAAGQVDVRVWGEKNSSSWQLTLFALKMIYQKLQLDGAVKDVPVLRNVAIRQAIHARFIEMSANVLISPSNDKNGISILNIVQLNMDQLALFVKDYTNPQPYDKGSRGSYQYEMIAQKFKDSCGKASALLNPLQSNSTSNPSDSNTPPQVTISVGDNVPYYQSNSYSSDPYNLYQVDVKYQTDYMNIHAPVANPVNSSLNSSSVMTVGSPLTKKIIQWTAEKYGDDPKIPNPQPGDSNLVLMSSEIQPASPGLMPDASSEIYRVSGRYVYAMKQPLGYGATLKTGALPWTTLSFSDGQYNNWVDGILDIGNSSGSTSSGTSN